MKLSCDYDQAPEGSVRPDTVNRGPKTYLDRHQGTVEIIDSKALNALSQVQTATVTARQLNFEKIEFFSN